MLNKPYKKENGSPLKLSPRGMKLLEKYVMGNCFDPLHTIVAKLNVATELHLSESTTRRCIRKFDMKNCIAIQKPFLSKKNMSARVIWRRTHKDWTLQQWSNVMFTDESCFAVRPVKNRLRVWIHKVRRLDSKHIVPNFKSGDQRISVWVASHRVEAVH